MTRSKEDDAARKREERLRKREKCGAEANAARMRDEQEQREAEGHEASERHKPDVAAPSQKHVRSKRIAEASALALALVEEIAQSENVLPEEREKQALHDKFMRAKNAASAFRVKRARLVNEQGNAEAQFKLGVMHLDGQYRDDVVATAWYRKAAEQGHAGAQNNLGIMYDDGRGVNQDFG